MKTLISTLMTGVVGATMFIGNSTINANDMLAQAQSAVNGANMHQISTVLELYYSDHGTYPTVFGGEALISKLRTDGYIENSPLSPEDFQYEVTNGGENYKLSQK